MKFSVSASAGSFLSNRDCRLHSAAKRLDRVSGTQIRNRRMPACFLLDDVVFVFFMGDLQAVLD
jgi:hypothetical protein